MSIDRPTLLVLFARDLLMDEITYDRYRLIGLMLDSAYEIERQRYTIRDLKYWLIAALVILFLAVLGDVYPWS